MNNPTSSNIKILFKKNLHFLSLLLLFFHTLLTTYQIKSHDFSDWIGGAFSMYSDIDVRYFSVKTFDKNSLNQDGDLIFEEQTAPQFNSMEQRDIEENFEKMPTKKHFIKYLDLYQQSLGERHKDIIDIKIKELKFDVKNLRLYWNTLRVFHNPKGKE
jgi:hypothetical protein